ncbi:GNAT family N-acetyltransferase [Kiritimatiellota bacterium B12222]|nr:GNAT family N-acetyltransferase [Kiritimatiellota bacterium B12222]
MPIPPRDSHSLRFIRTAQRRDIDRCCELLGQLAKIEQGFKHNPTLQRKGLEALLLREDAVVLVIGMGEVVIGMLSCQTVISTSMGAEVGLVEDVVIDQIFRGRGLGSALIHALYQWAESHNLRRLCLLAEGDNHSAHAFYETHHWQKSTMHAWYVEMPND